LSLLSPSFLTDRAYGRIYSGCIAGFTFRTDCLEKEATEPRKDRMLPGIHDSCCVEKKSSSPALEAAAIDAVKKLPILLPATQNNKPISFQMVLPVRFEKR